MSKKPHGVCRLCGQEQKLTFEHIPPESAFNNAPSKLYCGETVIHATVDNNTLPWDFDGIKYSKLQQQGFGYDSLCETCNNNTGSWYVPHYRDWAFTIHQLFSELKPNSNDMIEFSCKDIRPLPIIKQVLAMFCSVNENLHEDKELIGFILNKDSTDFNKDKYKVYMYAFLKGIERKCGFCSLLSRKEITVASEIAAYPLGFILCTHGDCSMHGLDISSFVDCKYEEKVNMKLCLPVHECNILFPLDYRTKEEIEACRIENNKYKAEHFLEE